MTTAEQLLTDYGEYFQQNNIIITALRSIFWFVLIILKDLVDILAGIMSAAYQLLTFDFSSLDGFIIARPIPTKTRTTRDPTKAYWLKEYWPCNDSRFSERKRHYGPT